MKLAVAATKVHKWVGLILGVQVILWIAGGLVMSWFPIERVRGEHNMRTPPAYDLADVGTIVPVTQALAQAGPAPVRRLELAYLLDRPVYRLEVGQEKDRARHILVDARDGRRLSPLSEDWARRIALSDFAGNAQARSVQLLSATNGEYRGAVPVWQVVLDDAEDTHIYVSPDTGRVVARRNSVWRLYDFFWMLHIMDYKTRSNFNHPLIIGAAAVALILSVSGLLLLFYRFGRRDFAWIRRRR